MESLVLIILVGIAVVGIITAKAGMAYLRQVRVETGYNPTGFLNSLLIIGVFVFIVLTYGLLDSFGTIGYAGILGIIACIVGLVMRNRVLEDTKRIVLVTFFQLLAPTLTLIGIWIKKTGGVVGNSIAQGNHVNVGGAVHNAVKGSKKSTTSSNYSTGQDIVAREFGYYDAKNAADRGVDMNHYL